MGVGATAMGPCPGGREMRFSSDFNKDKWEFITKEQGGGQWMENYWENIRSKRESC